MVRNPERERLSFFIVAPLTLAAVGVLWALIFYVIGALAPFFSQLCTTVYEVLQQPVY